MRGGMYWSGDLAYRDADGFVYFAGRSSEWLRVDGGVGDQVMAAVVLRPGSTFDPAGFEAFLDAQRDLGAKSRPRHIRVASALPRTATNKILKRSLQTDGVNGHRDPVWSRAERGTTYTLRT